jgi:aspartyl-tRNA(Asn)/glutamyl-tRNA(Gln) amidotransferase subunit C
MISKEEIKKLAELARIEIKEEELGELQTEIETILDYVGQVKSITGEAASKTIEVGPLYNVWREDTSPNEPGAYSKELIAEFPEKDGNYLKVKKIL